MFMKWAKSFVATYLPMITDKQANRVVIALTELLEQAFQEGKKSK